MFEKISFSDYFDSAKANGIEREVMLALEASMNELFNKKPKEYEGTMLAIHERINGKHFDKLTAHIGVEGLKNVDGTKGAHFSYDEVSAAIVGRLRPYPIPAYVTASPYQSITTGGTTTT